MIRFTPHAHALGLRLDRVEDGRVFGHVAQKPELVGDPDTGVIAGGVITAALDHFCGAAVMAALKTLTPVATLDLRIDYMRPAAAGANVEVMAHCYKVTRSVAFTRAIAFQSDPEDPIANAAGAFMLNSAPLAPAGAQA